MGYSTSVRHDPHEPCPFCGCPPPAASAGKPRARRAAFVAYQSTPPYERMVELDDCELEERRCTKWTHVHGTRRRGRSITAAPTGYVPATMGGREVQNVMLAA